MAIIKRFEDIEAWKLARELDFELYQCYSEGNFYKDFSFKDQISRASGSIMDNIAEGFERDGNREFINFLSYSKGSCGEVRSQLYRALDRKYITKEKFEKLKIKTENINGKISAFMNYLINSDIKGTKFKNR